MALPTHARLDSELTPEARTYLQQLRSPWKIRLYFLKNLPSAIWWGLRVIHADEDRCQVRIPFTWRTQNPFRSIYFAALAGAGELATGTLANMARLGRGDISMLVLEQRAEFLKKANTAVVFSCDQGAAVRNVVGEAVATGEPRTITMTATGENERGEICCRIHITWTFKLRQRAN
ncbi:MAG: hypothetical protein KatS3mg029_0647 [Saprospiraceae bacterium]|jgi:hypothetical protein|nr:MAG: hypothetical protein KatS3mg029_0647 [Saprospiraceae bacterium]